MSEHENLPAVQPELGIEKAAMSPQDLKAQVELIQAVNNAVMEEGKHYGVVPGAKKPSLFKPGAEKLALTFRLDPQYEITDKAMVHPDPDVKDDKGFVMYEIRCTLYSIVTGVRIGSGAGACNSKENKYRTVPAMNLQNTILKMAKKRALVDATLTATAASDVFTQDLEDMHHAAVASGETPFDTGGAGADDVPPPHRPPQYDRIFTGQPVPKEYWKSKDPALIGGAGYSVGKTEEGTWEIVELVPLDAHGKPIDAGGA